MPIIINLPKPKNPKAAFLTLKSLLEEKGIKYTGDEISGHGSGYGFRISYNNLPNILEVTVHQKPFIVTETKIRSEINKHYSEYLRNEKHESG